MRGGIILEVLDYLEDCVVPTLEVLNDLWNDNTITSTTFVMIRNALLDYESDNKEVDNYLDKVIKRYDIIV